ncbi:MAG TPA: Rieske (2Fe-2S) protein [Rubricoccaceae bacterium]
MPTDLLSTPVPRRGFLRDTCLLGAMMAVGAPLAAALSACDGGSPDDGTPDDGGTGGGVTVSGNTITLDLTRSGASALAAAGGFLYVASAETVAVNVDGTTVRAFSSVCPHEGNPVSRFSEGELVCPSHDSHFSPSTGARLSGPAPEGLQAYTVTRSGDVVTITKA